MLRFKIFKKVILFFLIIQILISSNLINVQALSNNLSDINRNNIKVLDYDSGKEVSGNINLNKKVIIKLNNNKKKDYLYRIQEKINDNDWKIVSEFSENEPYYVFNKKGKVALHIDIIMKSNPSNIHGIWLGDYVVLDHNSKDDILKNININDVIIKLNNSAKVIKNNNIQLNDKLIIEIKGKEYNKYKDKIELLLWKKQKGKDWMVVRNFGTDKIFYKVIDKENFDLQLDIRDKENPNNLKCFWLGNFNIVQADSVVSFPIQFKDFLYKDSINNINRQWVAILFMFFMGLLICLIYKDKLGIINACLLSFTLGCILYALISICILIIGLQYNLLSVLIIATLLIFLLYIRYKKIKLSRKEVYFLVFWVVGFGLISFWITYNNFAIISYDSFYYITFGKYLAYYKGFTKDIIEPIRSYGLFMPVFHSLSVFFNYDFSYSVHSLFSISFLTIFFKILYDNVKLFFNVNKSVAILFSSLGTIMLATCYFWIFQSVWIMNNVFTAILLSLTILFVWQYKITKNDIWIKLSFMSILSFIFTRVESPLYGVVLIVVISSLDIPRDKVKKYTIFYGLVMLLWYLKVFVYTGLKGGGDFLTINRAIPIMILYILFLVYLMLENKITFMIHKYLKQILICAMMLVVALFFIFKNQFAINNIFIICKNIMNDGGWGYTIFLIIVLYCLTVFMPDYKNRNFIECIIQSYLLFLLILFMFRKYPLRLGFGDSGNRMITHILPIIIFDLLLKISCQFYKNKKIV